MSRRFLTLGVAIAVLAAPTAAPLAQPAPQPQVLNVQNADIHAFIQDVARTTGRTFIVDPRVTGTVSVASTGALSRAELFEIFLSTLRANGLAAIPTAGGAYRIAPAEGVAQQPAGAGFATEVYRLRSLDAATAAAMLKPLVGPQGQVIPNPQGNTLVIADYADNLRRVRGLIAQIDQDRASVETVTLRFSSAREIAAAINALLAAGADRNARMGGVLTVIPVDSSNSVILRGDADAIRRFLPIVQDLDRRAEASGDVKVIHLQHANAEQLLPVLQQLVGQPVTPSSTTSSSLSRTNTSSTATMGTGLQADRAAPPADQSNALASFAAAGGGGPQTARIARYPGANALIIAAPPETQRTLADVIRQLDVRREQVLVEAIVVEVSDNAAKELGVQFLLGGQNGSNVPFVATNYSSTGPNLLALTGAVAGGNLLPESSPTLQALRETAVSSLIGTNGVLGGFGGQIGNDAVFGLILNAVKRDTASNLLSTPSVMTLDNEEARILVGQQIPVTTGEVLGSANTNPFRTIQRQDVGIQLEVKPQINADGAITLFLRQEVSSVAGPVSATFNELITDNREISTTVLVDDGDIVVLGGLLDQSEKLTSQKTPVLGDIPVVGNLFKGEVKERGRRNLMVFIRPRILRNPADARAVTAGRYENVRADQIRADREGQSTLDELVRDYLRANPPTAAPAAPQPASPPVQARPLPEARP